MCEGFCWYKYFFFHIFISPSFLDRVKMKNIFNSQFGSVFRTYHNPTYFSRRLFRFADIYMSSMTNLLNYSVKVNFDIFFSIFFSMSSLIFSSFSTIAHILSETRSHASRVHELFHVKLKLWRSETSKKMEKMRDGKKVARMGRYSYNKPKKFLL